MQQFSTIRLAFGASVLCLASTVLAGTVPRKEYGDWTSASPKGLQWYWKGDVVTSLPDEAIRIRAF